MHQHFLPIYFPYKRIFLFMYVFNQYFLKLERDSTVGVIDDHQKNDHLTITIWINPTVKRRPDSFSSKMWT